MSDLKPPNIPSLPSSVDTSIRRAFDALRGWFTDAAKAGGFASALSLTESIDDITAGIPQLNGSIPPKPEGVIATGAFRLIIVEWNDPNYKNFAHAEVWRGTTSSFSTAQLVGTTNANVYTDAPPVASLSVTYYYWVRFISMASVAGPYSDMVSARTADDPAYVLELLSGELSRTQLNATLVSELNTYSGYGTEISEIGSDLYSQYTLRVGAGGKVAGFGLSASPSSTLFEILADRFAIANTTGTGTRYPFIVDSVYGVVMDTALIKDGTITNAKIGTAAVDTAKIASLAVTEAKIANLAVTNAKIGAYIESSNYIAGSSGWHINKSGNAEFRNVVARGDITATHISAATGTFAGTLLAGTVDMSQLVGEHTEYANAGTYYYTMPEGYTAIRVSLVGGGGSGGNALWNSYSTGGGGGSGGFVENFVITGITPLAVITIVVAVGGAAGQVQAGGTTFIYVNGTIVASASGGYAGGVPAYEQGGCGIGGAGGSPFGTTGASGVPAYEQGGSSIGGAGGSSRYASGGNGCLFHNLAQAGIKGSGGGGGAGGEWSGIYGAAGGSGYVILEAYNPNGVVVRSEFETLKAALLRQNIAVV